MIHHLKHKLALIGVMIAVFLVPFYAVRTQLTPTTTKAYLAGAVAKSNPNHQATPKTNAVWSTGVGSNLIGSELQTTKIPR